MALPRASRGQGAAGRSGTRQVMKKSKRVGRASVSVGLKKPLTAGRRPPASWQADYPIIRFLRRGLQAPVDVMGCERLADKRASRATFEWQTLVAAMLSSQTKDQTNAEAMATLSAHGNTPENIVATPLRRLDQLIGKVGFHSVKAKNLKATARIILRDHGGRVPRTLEGLLSLPGVGPKMAYLTLHAAFGTQEGLCVDTHIHRIANVLGWLTTRTPEETRMGLEAWLPKRDWDDLNVLLVGFGQLQQQAPGRLVERCLQSKSPSESLRLLARLGVSLRPGKYPALDEAVRRKPALRRVLSWA